MLDLRADPTLSQFEALLASCEDEAGWHAIWVDHDDIARVRSSRDYPDWFIQNEGRWKLRLSAQQGKHGYVGPRVVGTGHVRRMFDLLMASWREGTTRYVEAS